MHLLDTKPYEKKLEEASKTMNDLDAVIEATGKPLSEEQQANYDNAQDSFNEAKKIIEHFQQRNARMTGNDGGGSGNTSAPGFQNTQIPGNPAGSKSGQNGKDQAVSREVNGCLVFANEQVPGEGKSPRINVKDPEFVNSPTVGFDNPEEFFTSVMDFSNKRLEGLSWRNATEDERIKYLSTERQIELLNAVTDGGEVGVSSDQTGSVFVPVEYSPEMFKTDAVLPSRAFATTRRQSRGRTIRKRYRLDKDHRRTVTGGFMVGRQFENCVNLSSAAKYGEYEVTLRALYGAYVASEELLMFNPGIIAQEVRGGFQTEFESNRIIEILNGIGNNSEYHGIWHSNAVIKIDPKNGASAGFTIGSTSITKDDIYLMNERLWRGGNREAAVWVASLKMMTPLKLLQDTNVDGSNHFMFDPNGGPEWADGTLDGIPIVFTEYCPPMGYLGCLGLYNMAEFEEYYWKPMKMASSMHAKFVTNQQVFKFWTYTGGRPRWDSTLIPKAIANDADQATIDANVLSPFILWNGDEGNQPKPSRANNKKAA